MPARPEGGYSDKQGPWYFKVTVGRDPLTGRREQITGVGSGRPLRLTQRKSDMFPERSLLAGTSRAERLGQWKLREPDHSFDNPLSSDRLLRPGLSLGA